MNKINLPEVPPHTSTTTPRFFYGWVMAPIAMMAQICTLPAQSAGVSVFNESFRQDLALSASQLSGAYALGTILASLVLPLFGVLQDRRGIRITMGLAALLLCCACQLVSAAGSLLVLFLGFFCLRLFGQGALSLTSSSTMSMWFHRTLGTVAGVTSIFITAAMAFGPLAIAAGVDRWGWRATYQALGLIVAATILPLLIPFRERPEDLGQVPDGEPLELSPSGEVQRMREVRYADALRTSSYWILIAVCATWSMIGTALIFDAQPLAADRAATMWPAAAAITVFFLCAAVMRLIGGVLADRVRLHLLLSTSVILLFLGVLTFLFSHGNYFFLAYAVSGLSQGLMLAVESTIWVRYFGRLDFGKIRSGAMTAMVVGSSIGPVVVGLGVDRFGSYNAPFVLFAVIAACVFAAVLFLRPPAIAD